MSARRRRRIIGVLGLVLLAGLWGGPAGADDITGTVQRVGWWTNRLGAQPAVEPARFEVAFGTDKKPTSVAAIDVALPVTPVQALTISLTELAGTANQLGHIRVCLAAPGWATANPGDLAQAPSMDCSNAADLTRSVEGNWLGDIGGLVPNGGTASLGVILVNDLDTPVTLGATVQISEITIVGQSADGAAPTDTTAPPVITRVGWLRRLVPRAEPWLRPAHGELRRSAARDARRAAARADHHHDRGATAAAPAGVVRGRDRPLVAARRPRPPRARDRLRHRARAPRPRGPRRLLQQLTIRSWARRGRRRSPSTTR